MAISNAQLAQQISDLVDYWRTRDLQFAEWLGGTPTGGPFGDGRFPLTDYLGVIQYLFCPAALESGVTSSASTAAVQAALAGAAKDAALVAQAAAESARGLALSYQVAAQSARDTALMYRDTAASHAANALVHRNAAAASATAGATAETNAETAQGLAEDARDAAQASATAADASADAAAVSASLAATFNPALFAALGSPNTFTADATLAASSISLFFRATGAGANSKLWRECISTNGTFSIDTLTDAGAFGNNAVVLTRSGTTVSGIALTATSVTINGVDARNATLFNAGSLADARLSSNVPLRNVSNIFTGSAQTVSATVPKWRLIETDADTDEGFWESIVASGQYIVRTRTDADGVGENAIAIDRAGVAVTLVHITADSFRFNGDDVAVINSNGVLVTTSLDVGGSYTTSVRDYAVTTAVPLQLKNSSNVAFASSRAYRVTGSVLGTGTHSGAQAVFFNESGTWKILKLYERGITSNQVEFFVDPTNGPSVRLWNHTSTYTVRVMTEELTAGGSAGGAPWGYQGFREIANVPYFGASELPLKSYVDTALAGKLGRQIDTWHTSEDSIARLHFGNNSHTYFRTGDQFVWRNVGNTTIATMTSAGLLQTNGTITSDGGAVVVNRSTAATGAELYLNGQLGGNNRVRYTSAGGTSSGFALRDDSAGVDRLSISSAGTVNVPGSLTVAGVAVSLAGHTHAATDIASGTLADARLSSNVPLKNAGTNAFTGLLNAAGLRVDGAAGNSRDLNWMTAGISRWIIRATSSAESGSNVGSDFQLIPRDDAGGALPAVFTVTRSSGVLNFAVAPLIGGSAISLVGHTHAAADITSGVLAVARLGTGTPSSSNFLRGDGAFSSVAYSNLTGVPSTFAPSAHSHAIGDITGSINAATLSGISIGPDGSYTANTVARHSSSGYFFAGYFNQSSSDSENPTIGQVMVTAGDNYFRKSSIAHLSRSLFAGSNAAVTVSTSAASGTPANGDLWIQYS